jgi:hypothetical protein
MLTKKKLTPLEALESIAFWIYAYDGWRTRGRILAHVSEAAWEKLKPGAFIKYMPKDIRDSLKKLKSHHFDKMCMDKWKFTDEICANKKALSEEKMKLDKKLKI